MNLTPRGIRKARTASRLTQAALARELMLATSTIARWEEGVTSRSPLNAYALEMLFDDLPFAAPPGPRRGPGAR